MKKNLNKKIYAAACRFAAALLCCFALVCVAAAAFCIRLFYGDRFPTGSRLGGLLCGGMKTEDVSLLLAENVEKKTVILSGGEGEEICTLPLSEAVGTADYAALAAATLKSSSGPDYPLSFAVESETLTLLRRGE